MDQFVNVLKELCEKAYFYIPTILAFISAVGIPSLVKIAEIVSNAKLYLQSARTLKEVVSGVSNVLQNIVDTITSDYKDELAELEAELGLEYNSKKKALIIQKIARVKKCIEKYESMSVKELIAQAGAIQIAKKVKVKVITKEAE